MVHNVMPTHAREAGGSRLGELRAGSNLAEGRGKIADDHNVRQGEGIINKVGAALQPLFEHAQRLGQPHLFRRRGLQCMAGNHVSRGLVTGRAAGGDHKTLQGHICLMCHKQ